MKITVVGFWGGYPETGEATSCYLVEYKGMKVVIDLGSGAVSQLQKYSALKDIDAVVFSHYHADHVADIGVMQYSRVVDLGLGRTSDHLIMYGHQEDQKGYDSLTKEGAAEGLPYSSGQTLQLGEMTFSFAPTDHPVPCYAMRVEAAGRSFVYTADTTYLESLEDFSEGTDLLFAETSFYEGQDASKYGHMNSTEAGRLARKAAVKKLVLTHLPHFGDRDELVTEARKEYDGPVELAASGNTYEL
ncbi:MBL fold metallo-hydrolase [Alteribacter natronophilus]|uniref:MBL fold metallo-hydrolase n=1 Tax=Alteribacter natronophilus TaxID=2583810 RepID=UPI00110D79DD|nr:MBL fold metallo-hydrolase [Alteribacter natronophilus]TMW71561.1 MBL fold metallo-hydrolase [Alteribacter natronophilus]